MCRRFSNRINTICFLIFLMIFLSKCYSNYYFHFVYVSKNQYLANEIKNFTINSPIRLYPRCLCQKEIVLIQLINKDYYNIRVENQIDSIYFTYNLTKNEFESLTITCDLYKVLRRGPNQKIISYSLYYEDKPNFKYIIKTNLKRAKLFYSDWYVRIYHKSKFTLNEECELECLVDVNSKKALNNLDICDVAKLPIDLHRKWNSGGNYLLPQILGCLGVGDNMVDIFMARF
jgi:hypothetical protein